MAWKAEISSFDVEVFPCSWPGAKKLRCRLVLTSLQSLHKNNRLCWPHKNSQNALIWDIRLWSRSTQKSIDWNLQLTQKFSYLEVALVHLVLKCIRSFAEKLPVESYETSLVLCHFSYTENCSYALLDALAKRYSPKLIRLFIYLFLIKHDLSMWVLSTDTSAADVNSGYVFGNNNIKLRHQQRRERSNYYSTSDL